MYNIHPIAAFSDNYIWAINNPETGAVIVVDPGDAVAVEKYLEARKYSLIGILITHHHPDHTAGLSKLLKTCDVPVFGHQNSKVKGITSHVQAGDTVHLMGLDIAVMEVPGHTLDHLAFFIEEQLQHPALFCGDTLFSAGCGRLFEGSAGQMFKSLSLIKALPSETQIYCAHEYTLSNLAFAKAVMPSSRDISEYCAACEKKRANNQPTLPSSMLIERKVNPFLRCDDLELIESVNQKFSFESQSEVDTFKHLRIWKDQF